MKIEKRIRECLDWLDDYDSDYSTANFADDVRDLVDEWLAAHEGGEKPPYVETIQALLLKLADMDSDYYSCDFASDVGEMTP